MNFVIEQYKTAVTNWYDKTKQAIQLGYANRISYSNIVLLDLRKERNAFEKLNRIHRFINT